MVNTTKWLGQVFAILALLLTPLLSTNVVQGQNESKALASKIDALTEPYLQHNILAGASVGILIDGQQQFFNYGTTEVGTNRKPDQHTVYEIGSISKVFTGLLLADAITRNHVKLDQPISELYPTQFPAAHASQSKITLAHLATHTSGLPRMPENFDLTVTTNPYAQYDAAMLFDFLSNHQVKSSAGSKFEYSNLAMGLLGYLIAANQQMTFAELLEQRILQPLQMIETSVNLDQSLKEQLAQGYSVDIIKQSHWNFDVLAAAGAIRSSTSDMLKFAQAQIEPPASLKEAIELSRAKQPFKALAPNQKMGLGWFILNDSSTLFHNGQTGGFHSALYVRPESKIAVVVLSNTATVRVDRLAEQILDALAGKSPEPRVFEKTLVINPEIMQRYVGEYQLIEGVDFTVTILDGKLMVRLTNQEAFAIYPTTETQWRYREIPATITFRKDKQGQWNELVLFQNGIRQRAIRKN